MSAFNSNAAYTHAIAIVTAGIASGSIKLSQPDMNGQRDASSDAKYLNELINALATNLKG